MIPPTDFAPIFKGWNVWSVWAKDDLDFEFLMVGVSDERRLRIWVEDEVRTHLGSADVDDPIDLKGSQVEILHGPPEGLEPAAIKDKVSGPIMLLDGKATLHYVRFFNRGNEGKISWPHDLNFLLDTVYQPSETSPVTQGPAPPHIIDSPKEALKSSALGITVALVLGGAAILLLGRVSK